jgi:mono/diheme cytochrome c family protein
MRMTSTGALTLAFGLCVTLAGIHTSPAAPPQAIKKATKKPVVSPAAQIAAGKAISEQNGCNSCHAATYAGKKGFSPSIRADGITSKYTLATWERVMDTGVTEDGGHVQKPMPVYHMPAAKSAPLYAFLKSQK